MDCCNYAQRPYGHPFYQQQQQQQIQQQQMHYQQQQQQQLQPAHQYCYENAYAPTNNTYDAYTGRITPAYPTDYVYNPKEARLRKAMREQSRELSRSSGQQSSSNSTTSSSSNNNSSNNTNGVGSSSTSRSSSGGSSSSIGANRIIGPWFPLGHAATPATHPKPILSPRVMAAHQRTLDKTKDVIRKQLECGGFPGYQPADYGPPPAQENRPEYCDFAEQKWYPYQNGVNSYHSRNALMSKMNSLHRGMQSTVPHASSAWGQFCNVPFPSSQSAMMRSNRHMVFLQEQQSQQSQQHCGYPDEMQMSYEAKMQDDLARRLHSSYSQEDQQVKNPLTALQLTQLPHEDPKCSNNSSNSSSTAQSCPEDGPRWGTPRPSSVSSSSCPSTDTLEPERPLTTASNNSNSSSSSKQPLPGFQQAFGSTEIGRFSRSELFASLVEAANNLIPSDGLLKSCTAFPSYVPTPVDSLNKFRKEELMKKRMKAAGCCWIETSELPDIERDIKVESIASPKARDYSQRSSGEWPALGHHHRDCECARPTAANVQPELDNECLDLRVPSRKKPKLNKNQDYPDSSVDNVEEKA